MRLRARHLAGLLLLLATLGTAEAASVRAGAAPVPTHCIQMLLAQRASKLRDAAPLDPAARRPLSTSLAPAQQRALAASPATASPAMQAAAMHAVTGRSL